MTQATRVCGARVTANVRSVRCVWRSDGVTKKSEKQTRQTTAQRVAAATAMAAARLYRAGAWQHLSGEVDVAYGVAVGVTTTA
jgi:hypothetical protein